MILKIYLIEFFPLTLFFCHNLKFVAQITIHINNTIHACKVSLFNFEYSFKDLLLLRGFKFKYHITFI